MYCGYLQGSKPQLALALQVAFSALLRSFCSCKLSIYMSGSRRPLCSTWVRLKCRIEMRELMQQRWRTWRFPCCSERGFCVLARTILWWICARMLFVQPSRVLASRRWSAERTVRIYIQDSLAVLSDMQMRFSLRFGLTSCTRLNPRVCGSMGDVEGTMVDRLWCLFWCWCGCFLFSFRFP